MSFYFVPPDLVEACAVHTTITTCQPQTFLFLQLVAQLFGRSKDAPQSQPQRQPIFDTAFNDFDRHFPGHAGGAAPREEYDFIVIGAGSAGCVVANRLTEVPEWRVLLLEAGDEEPDAADVPAFAPTLQRSSIDWAFMTQPSQTSCLARQNGQCTWSKGRVMGGSSTINYLMFNRGNPRDYDEWEEMGNPGWGYKDVFPYFLKSEDNLNLDRVDPSRHSIGGYQSVSFFPYQDINTIAILQGYHETGLRLFDQNLARNQIGASLMQHTSRDGQRVSTNVAFIRPIRRKRQNLIIQTNSYVARILIDPYTKTAFGVEYLRNGKVIQAMARKEVILSSGAIMSPKILMVSGIGPSQELSRYNIKPIVDLPGVGLNLQDHATLDGVLLALTNLTSTATSDQQRTEDMYLYKKTHRGPLSATGTLQNNAFIQTKYEDEPGRADIQLSIDAADVRNYLTDPILAAQTNVLPLAYYDGLMIRPVLLAPKSRGAVRLNNTDPFFGYPLVYANTFSKQIDLARIVEGIKQSLNLLKTPTFRKLGIRLVTQPWPNCAGFVFGSDEYWACVAASYTTTIFHVSCTCKMGPKSDGEAVVDHTLRVYGVRNLRVVDSSIMPKITRGNTNAPTIMIGEKASDFIKAAWLDTGKEQGSFESLFH